MVIFWGGLFASRALGWFMDGLRVKAEYVVVTRPAHVYANVKATVVKEDDKEYDSIKYCE